MTKDTSILNHTKALNKERVDLCYSAKHPGIGHPERGWGVGNGSYLDLPTFFCTICNGQMSTHACCFSPSLEAHGISVHAALAKASYEVTDNFKI